MKIKNPEAIINDFRQVSGDVERRSYSSELDSFFYAETYGSPQIEPLGSIASRKLAEFIARNFFPLDGSFLDIESEDEDIDYEAKAHVLNEINTVLRESNFYECLKSLIKGGLVYGRSYLDSEWSHGLTFKTYINKKVYLSRDSNLTNRRLYTSNRHTAEDMVSLFTLDSLPSDFSLRLKYPSQYNESETFEVIKGIIPCTSHFFTNNTTSKYKRFKVVYLLAQDGSELVPLEGEEYYKCLPVADFNTCTDVSLGYDAASYLARLRQIELYKNSYAIALLDRPKFIDSGTYERGTFNLKPDGLTVLATNEREPGSINIEGNLPYEVEETTRLKNEIKEIFNWNLIDQTKVANLSQGEAAVNLLAAIEQIEPLVVDFVTKSLIGLFDRIDSLLQDNDKDYRRWRRRLKGRMVIKGTGVLKAKLKKRIGVMRLAQAIVPYAQMDETTALKLNGIKTANLLANTLDVTDILNSNEDVAKIMKQQAQAAMQQQQIEQQKTVAETEKTVKETEDE